MTLRNLKLENFRNIKKRIFEFDSLVNVIIGPNASGKTNILESIFLLSTGKSFKAKIEEEMINYDASLARVEGKLEFEGNREIGSGGNLDKPNVSSFRQANSLEVVLTRGEIDIGGDKFEKAPRKKLLVNDISKRLVDFAGNLKTVLFGPWDMDLVTQSPALRRKFLDNVLSQVDREYRRSILSYEKGLKQRNRLLLRIREEGLSRSQLLFWDRLLIKNGDYISRKREEFVDFANKLEIGSNFNDFKLEYDKSAISEARLEQYAQEEIAAATTLVGPHRDDIIFKAKNSNQKERDLSRFGSRGEQRMAVLWLKLSEFCFIEMISGDKPLFLLDDIFSELDHEHRKIIFDLLGRKGNYANFSLGQSIITTADDHYIGGFASFLMIKL